MYKALFISVFLIAFFGNVWAQQPTDSLSVDSISKTKDNDYRFSYKKLIVPAICVTYGVASLQIDVLKDLNSSTTGEIQEHKPEHIIWDSFSQYVPVAMVYGLNLVGVEGKHNFRDRTIIFLTSEIIMSSVVQSTKFLVNETRPDGSDNKSFPSGHTATAFVGAQLQYREYKDKNMLIALSGYPWAVFTGIYRVVNNRHWVGDVVAGAGIGILSTEAAYWLYPKINNLLGGKKTKNQMAISPYYQPGGFGLAFVKVF